MMAMGPSVQIETSTKGGILKGPEAVGARRRVVLHEHLHRDGPRRPRRGRAPALPGDIVTWSLTGRTRSSCSRARTRRRTTTIDIDSKWGGAKTFFSREGLFMLKCTGHR